MPRVAIGALVASALAAFALAGTGSARVPAAAFKGTVAIKPFDLGRHCGAKSVSSRLMQVRCVQIGTYTGSNGRALASYGWTWNLPLNDAGHTTGPASERATLILNFAGRGQLQFAFMGKQAVIGTATATSAKAVSTGTWKLTKSTQRFAGRHGAGSYTFTAARTNSESLFTVAKLELSGSLG